MTRRVLIWALASWGAGWSVSGVVVFLGAIVAPGIFPKVTQFPLWFLVYAALSHSICAAACFHIWRKS